jgi:PBSX family phage terminase large subunit
MESQQTESNVVDIQFYGRQLEVLGYLNDPNIKHIVFGGGAGGGKSFIGCYWVLKNCFKYPGTRWLIGRKELKRMRTTTLKTFFDMLSDFGIKDYFHHNENHGIITCKTGSEIFLVDLDYMPSDPEYERLGGYEVNGAFIDEAGEVKSKCFFALLARLRYKVHSEVNGKVLMTCNPSKNFLYRDFYIPWEEDKLSAHCRFVPALAKDNPFLPRSYIRDLENIKDKDTYERLVNGNWHYDDDPARMLTFDEINDLFTNPVKGTGKGYISCDVARFGSDKTVVIVWDGMVAKIYRRNVLDKSSVKEVVERLEKVENEFGVQRSHQIIDEDGIGGGVVDFHKGCKGFVSNSQPYKSAADKRQERVNSVISQNYANLKAQCSYKFVELVKRGEIRIETDDNSLQQTIAEELAELKRNKVDTDNKLSVMPKDKIKERLQRSPDFLDALVMRMFFEVKPVQSFVIATS